MLSSTLPQLVHQLNALSDVHVHDTTYRVELHLPENVDIAEVDDLLCDAVFAEPNDRRKDKYGWVIRLDKLARPRKPSQGLRVEAKGGTHQYILSGYAA